MDSHVAVHVDNHVMQVRLNRPDKKNALTLAMYDALRTAIEQAETDPAVRVLLVTGTGDSFTSGNDLKDFLQSPPVGSSSPAIQFVHAISSAQKPIVAAVNGLAIGIGTTMLLHCDLVYAAESARFQLPFVNLALVPEAGASYILPRLMGYQKSAELLLLGEPFNARQALEAGFVNAILPDEELHEKALQVADALASKPPSALRQTKALLKRGLERATAEAMKEEFALIAERLQSAEAKEAMQAFMERRQPDFSRFTGEECHPRPS